jgi:predicted deacetylase
VHDVSPRTRDACTSILTDLASIGLTQCSLLVVADHHGAGHFLEDRTFCNWLKAQVQLGHEIVIHGYHHLRSRKTAEGIRTIFATRVYTADEGEFYDLDHASAVELLKRAREDFEKIGLKPDGFIAPAWLLGDEAARALTEVGVEYTTHLGSVTDLRTGQKYESQSLVWSTRSQWRRVASLAWNALLFQTLKENPLIRISIHPTDFQHSSVWGQIRHFVRRALRDRAPYTYERWITRERTFRAR